MIIDRAITERERYQALRDAGYSPSEARKYRRYGGQKFLDKLADRNIKTYNKARTKIDEFEKKNDEIIIPKIPRKSRSKYNYKFRYNYIIRAICEYTEEDDDGNEKTRQETRYYTYTTNREIPKDEIIPELQSYINTIAKKYKFRVVYWQLTAIEIK